METVGEYRYDEERPGMGQHGSDGFDWRMRKFQCAR